jgi:drug/metabolite transporter (DMT)-like permease
VKVGLVLNIHLKLATMGLLWASSYPLGRYLSVYEAPQVITACRAIIAFLFLAIVAYWRGQLAIKINREVFWHFLLLGICGFCIHNFLMFKALEYTEAGTGAVINGVIPALVVLADYVLFRRTVSRISLCGILLSFLGTALVVTHGDFMGFFQNGVGTGEGLFLVAIIGWTAYTVLSRPLLANYPAITVTAYTCLSGGMLMLPFVLIDLPAAKAMMTDPKIPIILFSQGVLTMGLGFLWYYEGIQRLGTAKTSTYLNLVPVLGVVLAAVTLGERPGFSLLVGGSLVIGGLLLANRD